MGGRLSEMDPPAAAPNALAANTVLDDLTASVQNASFNMDLGAALEAALDEAKADGRNINTYGVAALDYGDLYGDAFHEPVCEGPELTWSDKVDGEKWSFTIGTKIYSVLVGEPEVVYYPLANSCINGLAEAGGDVQAAIDAGDCEDYDVVAFLPEGSDCRACVEGNGGDFEACVDAETCADEAPATVAAQAADGEWRYFQEAQAYYLACAPDYTNSAILLATIRPDGTMPQPFDRDRWAYLCLPYWNEAIKAPDYTCTSGYGTDPQGDTLQVGVTGTVEGFRRPDDDAPYYRHRLYYTPYIRTDTGWDLRYQWLWYQDLGAVSAPVEPPDTNEDGVVDEQDAYFDLPYGGWGLNPLELRPDGVDPDDVEDTYARDWLAGMVLKSATTHAGIPIDMYNSTRCQDGAWQALDDGSFRCTAMGAPAEEGWLTDGVNAWYWIDKHQTIAFPIATLASTGLPDPDIPGGIVPYVASSPTLADPDWDDCTWDHTFVPDRVPLPDTPGEWDGPASLWGDGWRFDKHPDQDLRVLLNTNVARDFCPDGVEP